MYLSAGALTVSSASIAQLDHQPFGASRDGARDMQRRARRRAARQNERSQRLEGRVHQIDLVLEALDLRIG